MVKIKKRPRAKGPTNPTIDAVFDWRVSIDFPEFPDRRLFMNVFLNKNK